MNKQSSIIWFRRSFLFALSFWAFHVALEADVIFDSPYLTGSAASDFAFPRQTADDFALATTETAVHVEWRGTYSFNNTPTEPDDFTIRFFFFNGSDPNIVPFASYSIGHVGRVDTGLNTGGGRDIYQYSAAIPATLLTAGTHYGFSIVNNTPTDLNDNWFWATGAPSGGGTGWARNIDGDPWIAQTGNSGFKLFNVPDEGWTVALLGLSIIVLSAFFRGFRRAEGSH